jgi:nucleotide-binding universal stress UspA family protein
MPGKASHGLLSKMKAPVDKQRRLSVKHILVAVDGSDHALRALDLAADIAQKYDAGLVLVHVVDDKPLSDDARHLADVEFGELLPKTSFGIPQARIGDRVTGIGEFLEDQDTRIAAIKKLLGERILANASERARERGVQDLKTTLEHGDPATAILKVSANCEANLVVVGSRGRSDIKSLVLGSVSHKINNLSPVNVITVR